MANPITPNTLKGFVPSITAKVCEALIKAMLGFPAAVYRWYAWAFNADATASNALKQSIVPPGFVMASATTSVTITDWLQCNGQSVDRTAYPELFAAIGTTYGSDGATTFKVPNIVDRFIVGAGENALGGVGGLKEVTLTVPEMPAHEHVMKGSFLFATSKQTAAEDDFGALANLDGSSASVGPQTFSTDDTANDYLVASDQGLTGGPHENRPPFISLHWFIKT